MPLPILPPSMMGPQFQSMPPGQERQFMVHPNMPLPHFPPGMQQAPPSHIMQQQHPIGSMQPIHGSNMPSNLPPHSMPPQGLPPGMHPAGLQQQQTMHRMPPQSMPQGPFPLQQA